MKKLLSVMVFIFLLPVFAHAAETKEANCNSGYDCFDKAWYLAFDKHDISKWPRYAIKGCDQYNHGPSCMMILELAENETEFFEKIKKAAKQDFPFALAMLRAKQDDFKELKTALNNKKFKEFMTTNAGADKILNISKDLLQICHKQSHLLYHNNEQHKQKQKQYFLLSKVLLTKYFYNPIKEKGLDKNAKRIIDDPVDIYSGVIIGLLDLRDGHCSIMKNTVKMLEDYIKDKKKYDDL